MLISRKIGADRLGAIDFETQTMQAGELVFTIVGATDFAAAVIFALSRIGAPEDVGDGGIPATFMGATCMGVNQGAATDDETIFDLYMNYRVPSSGGSATGDVLSFSTGGGTAHIVNSLYTQTFGTAHNFGGAIGVSGSGNDKQVSGIDIEVANFNFCIERFFTAAQLTDSFIDTMRRKTNKVNLLPIFGAAAGEVRFIGADGQRANQDSRVSFKFSFSENQTDLTVGAVSGIIKNGHDYIDPYFKPGIFPPVVDSVFVHQVYILSDLRELGFT